MAGFDSNAGANPVAAIAPNLGKEKSAFDGDEDDGGDLGDMDDEDGPQIAPMGGSQIANKSGFSQLDAVGAMSMRN